MGRRIGEGFESTDAKATGKDHAQCGQRNRLKHTEYAFASDGFKWQIY